MKQRTRDNTTEIVEGVLKFVALGGVVGTALILQNSAQMFEKPLDKLFKTLERRQQERDLRRIIYYMKRKGLIDYGSEDYEHGITLTNEGRRRLRKVGFAKLQIKSPESWDGLWRLVFFDIPEVSRHKRNSLNLKLKELGFQMLQKSIWIHPFPCRVEIEAVGEFLGLSKYISYVEINQIDSEKNLKARFRKLFS